MNKFQINDVRRRTNLILLSKQSSDSGMDQDRVGWLEKYFLIRAIHIFGMDVPITESTDILVPTLGVSYKNIRHSLELLSTLGIVSMEKITNGRGRPVKAFQIQGDRLLEYFQSGTATAKDLLHQSLIDSLLCWGQYNEDACSDLGQGGNTRSKRAYLRDENHDLDGKARFYLAVLLAHADEFGFVQSLRRVDIQAISSLSLDQQARLQGDLLKKGYIRSLIKGFTCPAIFECVETVYCLNTFRGCVSGPPPLTFILFVSKELRQAHELCEASQLIFLAMRVVPGSKSIPEERAVWVRSLVDDKDLRVDLRGYTADAFSVFRVRSIINYLQFRLESYATWFLEIPGFNGNNDDVADSQCREVLIRITKDAFPAHNQGNEIDRKKVKEVRNIVLGNESVESASKILYQISLAMACKYHQFISRYYPDSLRGNERKFRVFPRSYRATKYCDLSIAIAALRARNGFPDNTSPRYFHVFDHSGEIHQCQKDLSSICLKSGRDSFEYHDKLQQIEGIPKYSLVEYLMEENLDEELLRNCGLKS